MLGVRLLIERSIIIDCCRERWDETAQKYVCEVIHEIILDDQKEYHCGLEPCLRGE